MNLLTEIRDGLADVLSRVGLLPFTYSAYSKLERLSPTIIRRNSRFNAGDPRDGLPLPPPTLITLVMGTSDISWFLKSGDLAVESMIGILERNNANMSRFEKVLDFGCGCGRVIRRIHNVTGAALYGTDADLRQIEWCRRNLSAIALFSVNRSIPPLGYPSDTFDFVYAFSVFTHFPREAQLPWMRELSRVLRSGGFLLMSTDGESYLGRLSQSERSRFLNGDLVVKRTKHAYTSLCTAFHPPFFVGSQMAMGFKVVDFNPMGAKGNPHQDIYLLRKQ